MPKTGFSLSPPDGSMVHVATVTASDDPSGVIPGSLLVTGTSNEPPDASQISIHPNGHGGFEVWLQAARSASGSGRVYTLKAEAMDHADNVTTVSAVCLVPKWRRVDAELGGVINGAYKGRENEREIIIVNPFGMSVEDLAIASAIYQLALTEHIGHLLPS